MSRPDAGFSTTEMVAALIVMSLVVVGLMTAARAYARALESLAAAAEARTAAPAFENMLVEFLGDLTGPAPRTVALRCATHRLDGECRSEAGAVAPCSLALQHRDRGWRLVRTGATTVPRTNDRAIKTDELRFVCITTSEGDTGNEIAAVLVERQSPTSRVAPWLAATP